MRSLLCEGSNQPPSTDSRRTCVRPPGDRKDESEPAFSPTLPCAAPIQGKHILVSGGSKGLGRSLAVRLAAAGARVFIAARGADRSSSLDLAAAEIAAAAAACKPRNAPPYEIAPVATLVADLTDYSATVIAYARFVAAHGHPDWVLCSAGGSVPSFFADQLAGGVGGDDDPAEWTMKVNYSTAFNLVRAVIGVSKWSSPSLRREAGKDVESPFLVDGPTTGTVAEVSGLRSDRTIPLPSRILLVGSTVGLFSFVGYGSYSSSKFALRGLFESLRSELLPLGVSVHLYNPGNMDTPGHIVENLSKPEITSQIEGVSTAVSPDAAAAACLAGILNGRSQIANEMIGEIIRITGNGGVPRPNPVTEVLAVGVMAAAFSMYIWIQDLTTIAFWKARRSLRNNGASGAKTKAS
ncbi:hypothetical protein DFJ73DRAFT_788824 [Zopfochytrium polystomum]|nr:hypothetical protein DFJ73DRAFT_788824 [Zopfochytrium polystomum]